jgi:hypothetical protein
MIPTTATTRPINCSSPGITVAATATVLTAVELPGNGSVIRIVNEGPNIVFVALGGPTVAATLPGSGDGTITSTAVLAGSDVVFSRDTTTETYISTICRASGTATLTVMTGEGN